MSSAIAFVRFLDGEVMYGLYHGTSDIMAPGLIDTPEPFTRREEVHGAWERVKQATDTEPVEVFSTYGLGHWWTGTASRSLSVFCGPHDPWNDAPDHNARSAPPEWAAAEYT